MLCGMFNVNCVNESEINEALTVSKLTFCGFFGGRDEMVEVLLVNLTS